MRGTLSGIEDLDVRVIDRRVLAVELTTKTPDLVHRARLWTINHSDSIAKVLRVSNERLCSGKNFGVIGERCRIRHGYDRDVVDLT